MNPFGTPTFNGYIIQRTTADDCESNDVFENPLAKREYTPLVELVSLNYDPTAADIEDASTSQNVSKTFECLRNTLANHTGVRNLPLSTMAPSYTAVDERDVPAERHVTTSLAMSQPTVPVNGGGLLVSSRQPFFGTGTTRRQDIFDRTTVPILTIFNRLRNLDIPCSSAIQSLMLTLNDMYLGMDVKHRSIRPTIIGTVVPLATNKPTTTDVRKRKYANESSFSQGVNNQNLGLMSSQIRGFKIRLNSMGGVHREPRFYPELTLKPQRGKGKGKKVTMNAYYNILCNRVESFGFHTEKQNDLRSDYLSGELQDAKCIDEYISVEIPHPVEDPQGYKLVTELMMHGACGSANLSAACTKGPNRILIKIRDSEASASLPGNTKNQTISTQDQKDSNKSQISKQFYQNNQALKLKIQKSKKLLEDLKELAEYKESLENSSKETAVSNSNEEKEDSLQDSDIHQLIEERSTEVNEEQKQIIEDTMLEWVKICRQKELLCIHDNVDDLIESALNSKLLSINSNSQRLDKKEQEVENVVEQLAERGTRYEHLSITPEMESDEVIESNAKNLVPIPSECEVTSEDESKYDMPIRDQSSPAFTTFSNPLFNDIDDLDSSDDKSLPDEDVPAEEFKIYSNPLFNNDEINFDKLNPHCFNVESDFVESLLNRDTFIDSSSKFDFSGELAHVNPEIPESDFDFEEEIHLSENLLYVNSPSQPPEEHNADEERIKREHAEYISRMEMLFTINPRPRPPVNANTNVESLPSLPIPVQDNYSQREEIDIVINTDDMLPSGVESDDDSDREVDDVDDLRVDNSILNSEHKFSKSEESDFDNPSVPLPPPELPDEEFDFEIDFGDFISVVRNTIVEFECIDAKVEFENDNYSYFMFAKVFSLLSAESEDTIFDPEAFYNWLLDVGNGEIGEPDEEDGYDSSWNTILSDYLVAEDESRLSKLIDFIYDDITFRTPTTRSLQENAIPIGKETSETELLYPMDYLNTITFPGFPPYELELKHKSSQAQESVKKQRAKMSETTIAALKINQENCILVAKVYRKWISKSVPEMKELAFCCILMDKENNAIQVNMDINNIDYFDPLLKPQVAYRFSDFICEKNLINRN
uniref:ATP-dependent DNA helicase PIF1-like n=1 Tax=Tanacetum cinerariifolium TaxID=118510 RepID=A0A6L2LQA1_TANCI|nr:ATP-dependent DNA helicase PIF1-like [Tanacetum cinerariifolium]